MDNSSRPVRTKKLPVALTDPNNVAERELPSHRCPSAQNEADASQAARHLDPTPGTSEALNAGPVGAYYIYLLYGYTSYSTALLDGATAGKERALPRAPQSVKLAAAATKRKASGDLAEAQQAPEHPPESSSGSSEATGSDKTGKSSISSLITM